ncbi:Purple acid phosphatase 3 [Zea mays]|uniref:Purple acid phosphatase 3 n=1 Tax=Zea mays TaxID=4577 RepID=A0A1D6JVH7_MAIZE|nr:Purple acid phosphatase 3 [Zea mays]
MANRSVAMGLALAFVAMTALCCAPGAAELPRLDHPARSDGSLKLLVVGDWGRKGTHNQSRVADQMGRVGEKLDIDFVISTGDNFYKNGLKGVRDQAFEESFVDIYTAQSLQKPWYSVLGNHDYRGNALAQLSPVLRKIDDRFICMRSFIVNAELVDFFFVDTTPFQLEYWTHPGKHRYDWRGVAPRGNYLANLLKDLDVAMKKSTARWKIVVGHHTMRSVSEHRDTEELLELLLPVLKVTFQKLSQTQSVSTFRKVHNNNTVSVGKKFTPFRTMASTSTSMDTITVWSTLAAETGTSTIRYRDEFK